MTSLKIEADLQPTEPIFEYSGVDLQKPLLDLYEHLTGQARELMSKIGLKSTTDLPRFADLTKQDPEAHAKQQIKLALTDAFEAQLWAAECKRTPDKVWRLTMAKLKWLYRQNAPT